MPTLYLRLSTRVPRRTITPRFPVLNPNHRFSVTNRPLWPRKGAEDKDSIDRESTEYSKSGTDDQSAAQDEAAFDADKTSPESQMEKAGEGNGVRMDFHCGLLQSSILCPRFV